MLFADLIRGLGVAALLTACTVRAEGANDTTVPRLPAGPHMGIIVGFDDLRGGPYDRVARAEALLDEAAAAGASLARIQIDWSELEPRPSRYDASALTDALEAAGTRGQHVFVTLSTLDSDGFTIPADLLGTDDRLRDGLTLAAPEVIDRFDAFLGWFVPYLTDAEVWGLTLGNEVDAPILDGIATEDGALAFYRSAADRVKSLDPDMGVSVTLTMGAPIALPDFTSGVMSAMTLATFNHYCLDGMIRVTDPDQWRKDVAVMKRAAQELPIMIQELGCPVGFASDGRDRPQGAEDTLQSSLETQNAHIAFFRDLYLNDPQFRAATVFQLYDWSPDLTRLFADTLRAEGLPVLADRFDAWLRTIGLCRWETGACGPAWDTWLAALTAFSKDRERR